MKRGSVTLFADYVYCIPLSWFVRYWLWYFPFCLCSILFVLEGEAES